MHSEKTKKKDNILGIVKHTIQIFCLYTFSILRVHVMNRELVQLMMKIESNVDTLWSVSNTQPNYYFSYSEVPSQYLQT